MIECWEFLGHVAESTPENAVAAQPYRTDVEFRFDDDSGVLCLGVDDGQSLVVSHPNLVLLGVDGLNGHVVDEKQQSVHVFQSLAVFPPIEHLPFVVGQPRDTILVYIRHKGIGKGLGVFSTDYGRLSVGHHYRLEILFLALILFKGAAVGFFIPYRAKQVLHPDGSVLVFYDFPEIIQIKHLLPVIPVALNHI